MKRHILNFGIFLAIISFAACTDDNENNDIDNFAQLQADVEEISNTATAGPWTITKFVDSGKNETSDFAGYGFTFNADGSLVADNGSTTITGTWSISIDDDSSDDSQSDSSNDDSQDHDCDSCTTDQLTEVLTACTDWYVEKLERNTNNLEDNYTAYRFNFMADGSLMVNTGSSTLTGSWEASGSGNNIQVVLTVAELTDIEDTWTLHEIELYQGESNVDLRINGEDRLRFQNNCTLGDFGGGNSSGEIDFNIFFSAPEDFSELTEDWNIISYSANKIELIDVSGGDGETDLLTFEK